MKDQRIYSIISAANNQKPAGVQELVNQILGERVVGIIESVKKDIASSLFEAHDLTKFEPTVKKNFLGLGYHPAIKHIGKDGYHHIDKAVYKTAEGAQKHAEAFHKNMATHFYGGQGLPTQGDAFASSGKEATGNHKGYTPGRPSHGYKRM